jgi:branched-chain amino acid transport system substrate-binding protein
MLGVDGRNAAELFVSELNARGGIKGRRLRLAVEDFRSDPSIVEAGDEALLRAGAIAIVGHFTSAAAKAALPFADRERIVLVSPTATAESLSGKDDYFFRTVMSSKMDPVSLVKIMKTRGLTSLLLIATTGNQAYTSTYLDYVRENAQITGDISYARLDEVSVETLKPFREARAVLIVASPFDTGTIAQRLRLAGIKAPVFASGWAANSDLIEYGGAAADGIVFVHQIDESLPQVKAFAQAYKKVYGSAPSFGAIETWDAMLLVAKVIEAGGTDRASFYKTIKTITSFEGISGPISLDSAGDATRPLRIMEVRGGAIHVLGTTD